MRIKHSSLFEGLQRRWQPTAVLSVTFMVLGLSACESGSGSDELVDPASVGQVRQGLTSCGAAGHLLGPTTTIDNYFPPQAQWNNFNSQEDLMAYVIGQSVMRDGYCSSTNPSDCASVWYSGGNYYVEALVDSSSTSYCSAIYQRLDDFLAIAPTAWAGWQACLNASGCNNPSNTSPPWEMWLPLGMAQNQTKAAFFLHYPPSACWTEEDYIDPTDPTVEAWNRKWTYFGLSAAQQNLYNRWFDADPIMANGSDGNDMPDPSTYFNASPNQLYLTNMLNWQVTPGSNANVNFARPLLVGGSQPRTSIWQVINARAGSPKWSVTPKDNSYGELGVGDVGVTTTTTGVGGKMIAMLGTNHPDVSVLANCIPSTEYATPMQAESIDLQAACWATTFASQMDASSTASPDAVAIRNTCQQTYNPAKPDAALKHTLCKLAVQDFTPIKVTAVSGGKVTQYQDMDNYRCNNDAQADALCKAVHDDPCYGFQAVTAGWQNKNCQDPNQTGNKWESNCSNGIDDDGDGVSDCADSDCNNAANCDAGDGYCCSAQGTKGCMDEAGENYVCACDSYCCNTAWDATCATEYTTVGALSGYPCTTGFGGKCAESNCTDGIDDSVPANGKIDCQDAACATLAICNAAPLSGGSCCTSHASPGCRDKAVQYYVCSDPAGPGLTACCSSTWGSSCVSAVKSKYTCIEAEDELQCGDGIDNDGNGSTDTSDFSCKGKPGGYIKRSCCTASTTEPFCSDPLVYQKVCATNPSCCGTAWTSSCIATYNSIAQFDKDGDGTADACELGLRDIEMWGHNWDVRSDKSTGGMDDTYPYLPAAPGAIRLTNDGTTPGYGTTIVSNRPQTSTNQFTAYFEYKTNNPVGSGGHGLSFFWDKDPVAIQNNASPSGDSMGFLQDNKGFAVFLDVRLGFLRVYGGTTQLASAAVTGLPTGNAWKSVTIRVGPNQVEVFLWNSTIHDWESKLLYTHTTTWNADSRGTSGDAIGFGAGTSPTYAAEMSIRAVNIKRSARAFITSTTFNGNLGGLGGADRKCQDAADAAGIQGAFRAWLSTSTVDAQDQVAHSIDEYITMNGALIANHFNDLTNNSIATSINRDEFNNAVADETPAWTGTTGTGLKSGTGAFCGDWTSASSGSTGAVGRTGALHLDQTWTHYGVTACSNARRLYCVEVVHRLPAN